jgi:replicative DNA helicase
MNTIYVPERDLITLLLRREFYDSYFDSIDLQHIRDEYKELYYVYKVLQSLHRDYIQDFSLDDLQAAFFTAYPDVDKGIYLELFKTLSETQIDPTLGVGILKQIKRRKTALKLSEAAFKFSTGSGELTPVNELLEELNNDNPETTEDFEFVSGDLEKLLHEVYQDKGLRWRLDCLNKSLGSLRKGNFGFLFARPESGKTTFLASEVSYMLQHLPDTRGPIIWFNNEQVGAEVMLRVHQGFHGVRLEQLLGSTERYKHGFPTDSFRLVDDALIGRSKVEAICKQLNPSLVVFDQIDKIKGFDADREDLRLGAIYIWARELAKRYCPVIGVCQADGTAEGQKWLTMDNVANAKTSKQAEADWILGMGNTHAEGAEYIRYLNISKNKLLGDEDTIPHMRHARMQVLIEPEIARFKDIENYD